MELDDDEEEEDEDDEEDEYSDDEDTSWKVRRASAKLLSAVFTTSPSTLEASFDAAVPRLLSRFRVGADRYCSPRHRMPFDSRNEGACR